MGDVKEFTIIALDTDRKRISLSLKSDAGQRLAGASTGSAAIGEHRTTSGGKKVMEKLGKRGKTAKLRYTNTVVSPENKYTTYNTNKLAYDWQPSVHYYTSDADNNYPSFIGLHILGDFGKEKIGTPE